MTMQPSRGLVLGKFMPPHNGHRLLVDYARQRVDELAIVVGTLPTEPIPGALRFRWMQELFGPHANCTVLHLDQVLPQYPEEAPNFWEQWRSSLQKILPWSIDWVFASEDYGQRLAQELGARFEPLDIARNSVQVSGTAIRSAPLKHWQHLPDCVRPYFVKHIAVVGPESSGKSTLAQQLAQHYGTPCVPEYAEILLRHQEGQLHSGDLLRIARAQLALIRALSLQAQRCLIWDTEVLSTCTWSEELYQELPQKLLELSHSQPEAFYLLCTPDLDWVDDTHRLRPNSRQAFFDRLQQRLEATGKSYAVISGPEKKARFRQAVQAIHSTFSAL